MAGDAEGFCVACSGIVLLLSCRMILREKALALVGLAALITLSVSGTAQGADKVVLRVRAGNATNRVQTVQIRSMLPAGVTTNDIISLGGLDLVYDVHAGVYCVRKDIQLGPKEIAEFAVEIRDVWQIAVTNLDALAKQAGNLAAKLQGTPFATNGQELAKTVVDGMAAIRARQDGNEIKPGAPVVDHIRAYEANLEALRTAKRDLGRLETLVVASGRDPGGLMGDAEKPTRSALRPPPESSGRVVIIQIRVQNTSTSEVRKVSLRRDLPPEIEMSDVLDAGELLVGHDPAKKCCYVWKDGIELEPGGGRTFDVRVRDRWNVSSSRIGSLRKLLEDLRNRARSATKLPSIGVELEKIGVDLDRIAAEEGPSEISDRYVAFHHERNASIDVIEDKLNRIESLLRPVRKPKYGLDVQPPNLKTTWGVIWGIIGFLGVISLLFFLRWYGRSKSERHE